MSRGGDFWSRRQAAVQAEEEAAVAAEADREVESQRAEMEAREDAEILAELNLPDPDDLKPGDDVSAFMAKVVPDRLRRRALRQLWRLNPVLANIDGLVDYGEDFTDSATVVENLQTTYQVGKGMLAHIQEMARQAEAETEDDALPEAEPEIETPHDMALAEEETPPPAAEAETPNPERADENPDESLYPATGATRRMRFAFDDTADKLTPTTGTT
ncbi:DUF3306 domain-containing protein [Arenibacterium sp. CAU 1754]